LRCDFKLIRGEKKRGSDRLGETIGERVSKRGKERRGDTVEESKGIREREENREKRVESWHGLYLG
jgi:hypothetical protein